jgi:hypothetical protein
MRTGLLTLLCVTSLTGCLESEAVLELNPNGGGTVTVDVTLDLASSAERLQVEGVGEEAALRLAAADVLGALQGVECWSDLESSVTESGRIRMKGKAWFRDASTLSLTLGDQQLSCALEVGATEGALRLVDERGSRLALALLQYGPKMLEQVIQRRFGADHPNLRQLTVKLPGSVKGASYAWQSRDETGASLEDTPAGWQGLLERYQTRVDRLTEAGKIGGEDDDGSVLRQVQMLFAIPKLRWTIDPAAGEGFAEAMQAATAAWAGSEWQEAFTGEAQVAAVEPVEPGTAVEPDTAEPDTAEPDTAEPDTAEPDTAEPDTAEPADEDRITVVPAQDPYEDNDVQAAAAAIGAGRIEDLQADGQDWFQLEIQPGQTLLIEVEKAPAANLGIMLLAGGNLRRGSDGVEWSNSASEPRLAQFVITGRGFYHLNVAVE